MALLSELLEQRDQAAARLRWTENLILLRAEKGLEAYVRDGHADHDTPADYVPGGVIGVEERELGYQITVALARGGTARMILPRRFIDG